MKRMMFFVVMAVLASVMVHGAYAGEEGDSIALAKKAALIINKDGRKKGLAEIMTPSGTLKKGSVMVKT